MSTVSVREDAWRQAGSDRNLFYRMYSGADTKALVVIVHGFGEHGGRYQDVARVLAESGIAVAVPDLWGHGSSGGGRGDIPVFGQYIDDLQALTDEVFLRVSGNKGFSIYGHSFGGLVGACWAMTGPVKIRRLVVQSPLFGMGFSVPWWKSASARLLGSVAPSASLPMNLDVSFLSHDEKVQDAYREDPLVHNRMSARAYIALVGGQAKAFRDVGLIKVPTLMLYGEADRIISTELARKWFKFLTCEKQITGFAGAYHELHNERLSGDMLGLVQRWILKT